jgi:hypothetical protein
MRLRSHETGDRENGGTVPSRHACRVTRWGLLLQGAKVPVFVITRLRLKWLWFRHMAPVLFAHKPLCEHFARDVVHVGPWRMCRSCVCLYAGVLVAAAILGVLHAWGGHVLSSPLLLGLPVVLGLSAPPIYRRMPRFVRDLLRFATGALVGVGGYLLLTGSWLPGLTCALVLLTAWRFYRSVRRSSMTDPCVGCPDLKHQHICPGYAPQADRFRAYEEEASALINASGYVPDRPRKR